MIDFILIDKVIYEENYCEILLFTSPSDRAQ